MRVAGRRVVVAGAGPLLLAVAAELVEHGAIVPVIAEQAPPSALRQFGLGMVREPAKFVQAAGLKWRLRGTRYTPGTWPIAAEGDGKVEVVALQSEGGTWREPCDYLACGFGLVPNLELPLLLGCEIRNRFVSVDQWQQTSIENVLCAGEPTGIGGVDLALASGQIAGSVAAGKREQSRQWFSRRDRAVQFKNDLAKAFTLRDELRAMAKPETLVCRCEDVSLARLAEHESWRAGKLQTRCGMGPCQGRICGPAVEYLLGWKPESVRPPIFPARVEDLCRGGGPYFNSNLASTGK
jgi:NADPH-dependent 2,4-dienoyl-CoA reductase/sulfur reductase-like enzyme